MKNIILFTVILLSGIGLFGQTTTTSKNQLAVPNDSKATVVSISKTSLAKINQLTCAAGEISSYTIAFKEGNTLFSKKIENNIMDENIKDRMLKLPAGSKFYLDNVLIKGSATNTKPLKAEYMLTE